MALPLIFDRLRLPVIGSPLFTVSGPDLVIAQCKAGIVGSFPALNARLQSLLDEWLHRITEELAAWDRANPDRLSALCRQPDRSPLERSARGGYRNLVKWKVPITITSLSAREELNQAVHGWGGITLHDVIDDCFARKAIEAGADGLILAAAGAGGHAGTQSPLRWCRKSANGSMARWRFLGALRTVVRSSPPSMRRRPGLYVQRFIAAAEANADDGYKNGIVEGRARPTLLHWNLTGVHGNYLRQVDRGRGDGSRQSARRRPLHRQPGSGGTPGRRRRGRTSGAAWARDRLGPRRAPGCRIRRRTRSAISGRMGRIAGQGTAPRLTEQPRDRFVKIA